MVTSVSSGCVGRGRLDVVESSSEVVAKGENEDSISSPVVAVETTSYEVEVESQTKWPKDWPDITV